MFSTSCSRPSSLLLFMMLVICSHRTQPQNLSPVCLGSLSLCLFSLYALLVFLVIKLFAGQKWAVPLICSHVFILSLVLLTIFLRFRKHLAGHKFDNFWPHQQKEIQQKWRFSTLKLCGRNGDEWRHSTAEQMIRSGGGSTERHNGTKVNNEDAASVV
uniref:Transmembrane protein n=1 Tax=Globodera pallida TaxID=36090 RepID=A0A183CLR5_GLOPA